MTRAAQPPGPRCRWELGLPAPRPSPNAHVSSSSAINSRFILLESPRKILKRARNLLCLSHLRFFWAQVLSFFTAVFVTSFPTWGNFTWVRCEDVGHTENLSVEPFPASLRVGQGWSRAMTWELSGAWREKLENRMGWKNLYFCRFSLKPGTKTHVSYPCNLQPFNLLTRLNWSGPTASSSGIIKTRSLWLWRVNVVDVLLSSPPQFLSGCLRWNRKLIFGATGIAGLVI